MTTRLEELLFRSLVECDETAVLHYVSKGANPNKITSQGKTCLGEACRRGIISLVKLLLESCNEDSTEISNVDLKRKRFKSHKRKFKAIEYNGNVSKCEHRSEEYQVDGNKSKLNSNKSQDYIVLLSSDGSSSDESRIGCNSKSPTSPLSSTTVPLADLEWDEDIGTFAPNTSEDETWSSMYRWYAAILEDTGAAIAAAAKVSNGINQQDAFMRTALHYAAEQGHTEVVKLLLDSGSKLDLIAGDGLTSLHVSVIKNNIETVKLLLSAGSQINYKTHEKMTALHFAASRGYLEIVKLLINSGAYIEARDTNERTALYLASGRGHVDVIQYLIFSGANVNGEEIHGYTPLCEAVWHRYTQVVELLLYSGARVTHSHKLLHNAIMQGQEDIVRMLINQCGGINLPNDAGDTPLLLAIRQSQISIVKELLKKNVNVNICNSITGASALHIAVEIIKCPKQFEQLLIYLLDYKIDINSVALTGDTALNRALLLQKDYAAILLIQYGADVNTFDLQPCGLDNLSIVKKRKSNNLASLLLKAGHYKPICEEHHNNLERDTTAYWLYHISKEPFSLLDLCRIKIRILCKQPLHRYIPLLPLPNCLKKFLMFKDLL